MSFLSVHQQQQQPEECLISLNELVVIAGVDIKRPDLTHQKISKNEIVPELLDIFPQRTKGQTLPPYLENLNMWLFPDGVKIYNEKFECLNTNDEEISRTQKNKDSDEYDLSENIRFRASEGKKSINSKEALFHFVMTDEKYIKRFCTCLLFYEKCYIPHEKTIRKKRLSRSLPKLTIESLLKNPMAIDPEIDLIYVPKAVCLISRLPVFDLQKQFLIHIYRSFVVTKRDNKEKMFRIAPEAPTKSARFTIPSPEMEDKMSRRSLQNASSSSAKFLKETELLEFYISILFSLTPLGEEACEKVFMNIGSKSEELLRFRLNTSTGLNLMNFSFKSLIKKLSMDNILRIVKHIILERQIILFSSEPGEIANITESLLYLISPLTWGCIYIPYMPVEMWETLDAMMPFIVGMDKKYKDFVKENICLKDKILIDLDNNLIEGSDTVKLPILAKNYLITRLNNVLIQRIEYKNSEARSQSLFWAESVLRTKQIFNNFFLGLINNFLPFYKSNLGEELIVCAANDIFNFDAYVKLFPAEDKDFYREFSSKTMLFSKFIEDSAKIVYTERKKKQLPQEAESISSEEELFIYQLRKINKRSGFTVTSIHYINMWENQEFLKIIEKEQNNQIHNALLRFQSPEEIDLTPYLIRYVDSIEGPVQDEDSSIHQPSKDSFIKKIEKWFLSDNKLNFVKTDTFGRIQINISLQILQKLNPKNIKNLITMETIDHKCSSKCNDGPIMEDSGELQGQNLVESPIDFVQLPPGPGQEDYKEALSPVDVFLRGKKMSVDIKEKLIEGRDDEGSVLVESMDNNGRKSIKNYFAYYHAFKRNVAYGDFKNIQKNHSVILSRPRNHQGALDLLAHSQQQRTMPKISPRSSQILMGGSFATPTKARGDFYGFEERNGLSDILRSNTVSDINILEQTKKVLNFEDHDLVKKPKKGEMEEK